MSVVALSPNMRHGRHALAGAMDRPAPGQIDVYGDPSCYIAVHVESGGTVATFYPDEDEGWWRINTGRGVMGMWVPPRNPEPWREIVERLLRA